MSRHIRGSRSERMPRFVLILSLPLIFSYEFVCEGWSVELGALIVGGSFSRVFLEFWNVWRGEWGDRGVFFRIANLVLAYHISRLRGALLFGATLPPLMWPSLTNLRLRGIKSLIRLFPTSSGHCELWHLSGRLGIDCCVIKQSSA